MQRRHAKRMTSLMLLIVFIAILIIGQSAKSTYAETATSSNIDIPVEVDWKGNYRVPVNVNLLLVQKSIIQLHMKQQIMV